MKLTTLIENSPSYMNDLKCEHGLSIYIENNDKKILFDTGKSENFIKNAEALQVDLTKLDYIILSHGHYDHCGGLKPLLNSYSLSSTLCMHENFFKFSDKYKVKDNKHSKYIGIDFEPTFIKENNIKLAGLCHCSGEKTKESFKKNFNGTFFNNDTGNILDFI